MTERGRRFLSGLTPHEKRMLRWVCFSRHSYLGIAWRLRMTPGAVASAQWRLAVRAKVNSAGNAQTRHRLLLFVLEQRVLEPPADWGSSEFDLHPAPPK